MFLRLAHSYCSIGLHIPTAPSTANFFAAIFKSHFLLLQRLAHAYCSIIDSVLLHHRLAHSYCFTDCQFFAAISKNQFRLLQSRLAKPTAKFKHRSWILQVPSSFLRPISYKPFIDAKPNQIKSSQIKSKLRPSLSPPNPSHPAPPSRSTRPFPCRKPHSLALL